MAFRTVLNASGTRAECFLGPQRVATIGKRDGFWVATAESGDTLVKTPAAKSIVHHEPGYPRTRVTTKTPIGAVLQQVRQSFVAVNY